VIGKSIQYPTHPHDDTRAGKIGTENRCAVGSRKNGLMHIDTDFAPVGIESDNDFDIAGLVSADLPMHQAGGVLWVLSAVVVNPLYQGAGAIADSDNGYFDLIHLLRLFLHER